MFNIALFYIRLESLPVECVFGETLGSCSSGRSRKSKQVHLCKERGIMFTRGDVFREEKMRYSCTEKWYRPANFASYWVASTSEPLSAYE
jgi:hypothetical protein